MRDLVLAKIEKIKNEESGFKTENWKHFYVGHIRISEFDPNGMQDEMLLSFLEDIIRKRENNKWAFDNKFNVEN